MIRFSACIALSVSLVACAEPESKPATVDGNLVFDETIELSSAAVATVTLQDVSLADAPSVVVAKTRISDPGKSPVAYQILYPVNAIDERMSYSVRAQVREGDRLVLTSDTVTPVLTRGAGRTADLELVEIKPSSTMKGAALAGMFRYMADAALFLDCRTNKLYPVAMEGAYIELERAYLDSGITGGEELMVNVEGRFLERPAMEGDRTEVSLVVDTFIAIHPERSCPPMPEEPLQNTYWKLVELDGQAVISPDGRREAHMILYSEDGENRVKGNAGCNRFFGGYDTDDTRKEQGITFGRMGATMMACIDGMDTERAFLDALENADRYVITGQTLAIYQGDTVLARFEAVHF